MNQNGESLKEKADFSVVARLISKLGTQFIIIIIEKNVANLAVHLDIWSTKSTAMNIP